MSDSSPDTRASEPYPFWGYHDVVLFIALSLPCLLGGYVLTKGLYSLFHWRAQSKAFELLPAQFLGYGLLFFCLYLIFRVEYRRAFWRSLDWVWPRMNALGVVIMGFALAVAISLLGVLLRIPPNLDAPIRELLSSRGSMILVGIFAVTLGPLCEELAFRGFLQPLLVRSLGAAVGIFLTSVPFGLLHLQEYSWSWRHALLITLAGCAFGVVRYRTRSTAVAAVMHAAYNSTFFLAAWFSGESVPATW